MGKPVEHSISERPSQVLVTLEDFTSLRGSNLLQGIYFVVFGFNLENLKADPYEGSPAGDNPGGMQPRNQPEPSPESSDSDKYDLESLLEAKGNYSSEQIMRPDKATKIELPSTEKKSVLPDEKAKEPLSYTHHLNDFFFAWHTPVYKVQRGRPFKFENGLPLFFAKPERQASIYVAALEAPLIDGENANDRWRDLKKNCSRKYGNELKSAVEAFQKIDYELDGIHLIEFKRLIDIDKRERKIEACFDIVKNVFSLLIKEIETLAIKPFKQESGHKIRYTNVFTFRQDDEWLEGGHKDWGDHRMSMTLNVEVAR